MSNLEQLTEMAQSHLDYDEEVVVSVLGCYAVKLMGRNSLRTGVFLASYKRLFFYARKLSGYDSEEFPYQNISSFELSEDFIGHTITFRYSGIKITMKWIKHGDVEKFTQFVKGKIYHPSRAATGLNSLPAQEDIYEKIRRLKELADQQVLSQQEFETKKQELLSQI